MPETSALDLDPATGWCKTARRCPSPNFNARPAGVGIDLLVIHGISLPAGHYGGPFIEALFLNQLDPHAHTSFAALRDLRVSAHFLIRRDGALVQFVSTHDRAWHAGVSSFEGRGGCNDFSIGIELEGCDDEPYESFQYERLIGLTRVLCAVYPGITSQRIVGHCDIAPGRKTDPGARFDWPGYRAGLIQPR
jgi:AmpD protein